MNRSAGRFPSRHAAAAAAVALAPVTLVGGAAGAQPQVAVAAPITTCHGEPVTIAGTAGQDQLEGTDGRDVIHAGPGRDRVDGLGGDDVICGGRGADELFGGTGADTVDGGDDRRHSMHGDTWFVGDTVAGGPGDDLLVGGDHEGADTLTYDDADQGVVVRLGAGRATGEGSDELAGFEIVVGSERADRLVGRADSLQPHLQGSLRLAGEGGPDRIRGDGELDGGDGRDTVHAAGGYALGGNGADEITYEPWAAGSTGAIYLAVRGGSGDDLIDLTQLNARSSSGTQPGGGDDVVSGGEAEDFVSLSAGDDTVTTGGGDDGVYAGHGLDRVWTGPGDDGVKVWCGSAELRAGTGRDTVEVGLFWTSSCMEPGDDLLAGGAGRDTLSYQGLGHPSTDGVTVDLVSGTATGPYGNDIVRSFQDVVGSEGRDTIRGGDGPNLIFGRRGADDLAGGGGDDELRGDQGNDVLAGDSGVDTADGGDGTDACDDETVTACE